MNILILSNCPLVESQGSGYVIINTAKSLSGLGHKVDLIPPTKLSFLPSMQGTANTYRMVIGMAVWVLKNRKKIANYQMIIFYGAESSIAVFILKKILKANIKTVLHSNGIELHVDYRLKSFSKYLPYEKKWHNKIIENLLFNYCYKHIDAIVTVSKYDKAFALEHLNIPSEKVYYNEPCLPEVFFEFNFENPSTKKLTITYCGSWIPRKGIESIKNALPDILRKYPDYTFRIIGVGDNFQKENYFPEDVLKNIEVYPLVKSKEKLIQLYSESMIFLSPSFCESFGLVVVEAMFCDCAVICGPTGIGDDLKNNEEAIVLQLPDTENLYIALETVITDSSLRDRLAYNGKRRTEVLKWENYTLRLNDIINDIKNKSESFV